MADNVKGPSVGDTVVYHPGTAGRPTCEATITAVNDDGTVNIEYPHYANPEVQASADSCQWGNGIYQVALPGDAAAHEAISAPALTGNVAAKIESLQTEVERLTGELVTKTEALAAAGADDAKKALSSVASFVDRFGFHPDDAKAASKEAPKAATAKADGDDDKGKK